MPFTIYDELAPLLNLDPVEGSDPTRLWKDPFFDREHQIGHAEVLSAASTPEAHKRAPRPKIQSKRVPPPFYPRKAPRIHLPRHGQVTNLFPEGSGIQAVRITNKRITKVQTKDGVFTPQTQPRPPIVSLHELRSNTTNEYTAWTDTTPEWCDSPYPSNTEPQLDITMGSDDALNDSMDTEQAHDELDAFFL